MTAGWAISMGGWGALGRWAAFAGLLIPLEHVAVSVCGALWAAGEQMSGTGPNPDPLGGSGDRRA